MGKRLSTLKKPSRLLYDMEMSMGALASFLGALTSPSRLLLPPLCLIQMLNGLWDLLCRQGDAWIFCT